ncbi:MAG: hypothetical protein H0U03_00405 [Actinobacteria bacterium]|nr:hypothetical protein [Actinomycetota bacterium]
MPTLCGVGRRPSPGELGDCRDLPRGLGGSFQTAARAADLIFVGDVALDVDPGVRPLLFHGGRYGFRRSE